MYITVIIATAFQRTHWLIHRSLHSVYKQVDCDSTQINILIVDDNQDETEYGRIQTQIADLRHQFELTPNDFVTAVVRNQKTRFMSGTGAWNTGIEWAFKIMPTGYVSILDDDDAYLPHHIADCIQVIQPNTAAIFQSLQWINEDHSIWKFPLTHEVVTPTHFFIGNPGIQGSNMFFKSQLLHLMGGFDEHLPNTTDRDLMIRFLWLLQNLNQHTDASWQIQVLTTVGVLHYNHATQKVNNQFSLKHQGLNLFYNKYKTHFNETDYQQSLLRAAKLFQYCP